MTAPGEPLVAVELDHLVATLRSSPFLLEVRGVPQRYAWGGVAFIPELLGVANPDRTPYAELWFGSHPSGPAHVRVGREWLPIIELVRLAGDGLTGPEVASRFGPGLPYLLKVLDVRAMLSIQAHPDRAQAEEGFAREEAEGIERTASNRNYRDASHKPETSVALTDFWLLYGFKAPAALADTIARVPEFAPLLGHFVPELRQAASNPAESRRAIQRVYQAAMTAPAADADDTLGALTTRLIHDQHGRGADRSSPDYWAMRALNQFPPRDGHFDRGLLALFMLNLVHLAPGEAVFIPAGIPHAYLEGVAVEVMANSDNVLRGGLTPKHVDVSEIMRVLTFEPSSPKPLPAATPVEGERLYPTPAREFELRRLEIGPGRAYEAGPVHGADTLLVLDGEVRVEGAPRPLRLSRGCAAIATNGLRYWLRSARPSLVVRVSVPHPG